MPDSPTRVCDCGLIEGGPGVEAGIELGLTAKVSLSRPSLPIGDDPKQGAGSRTEDVFVPRAAAQNTQHF